MRWILMIWMIAARLSAADGLETNRIITLLTRVPAAELPAVAAKLVHDAKVDERVMTAKNVVTAAIRLNPAATPFLVGAVARAVPQVAAICAQVAAEAQPGQIEAITRAAVAVAPGAAGEIVTAVCRALPNSYRQVAMTAAEVAPAADRDILKGIGASRLDLKPYIEKEIMEGPGRKLSVERCLIRAETALARAGRAAVPNSGPNGGVAVGQQPQPATPDATAGKPPRGNGHLPGGRNYARP